MSGVSIPAAVGQIPLFILRGGNFQLTTDQAFTRLGSFTSYFVTAIIANRVSGGATVACLGGIYPAASKAGTPLVAAAQSWIGLSGAAKIATATLAAVLTTDTQTATPVLSLSTGSSAAIAADVYIFGAALD